jgi:hypothetical protein
MIRKPLVVGLLLLVAAGIAYSLVLPLPAPLAYLQRDRLVERSLLHTAALGSSRDEVVSWLLNARHVRAHICECPVAPNQRGDYPLSAIGGSSFIAESVAHYYLPFRTDVEAFYMFDASGNLVDLRVRKTTDSI